MNFWISVAFTVLFFLWGALWVSGMLDSAPEEKNDDPPDEEDQP